MKCFECGSRCVTEYIKDKERFGFTPIVAVRKVCTLCDWKSYPTKIPESITNTGHQ